MDVSHVVGGGGGLLRNAIEYLSSSREARYELSSVLGSNSIIVLLFYFLVLGATGNPLL